MSWLLPGAVKDAQTITAQWSPASMRLIDGVRVREVMNVPKQTGHLTEMYRADWALDELPVAQVFQVTLNPGAISAWHAHGETTDRIFVNSGLVRIALYDGREGSPTHGLVNEFRFGALRPALVVIPPRVWHGIQNVASAASSVINIVDRAYDYEDPDHWRFPEESEVIPYSWKTGMRVL